jgi:hypothetical protein
MVEPCASPRSVADLAAAVEAARGGGAAVVGIDGRSGSGKTALAERLTLLIPHARVIHLDDVYRGWSGLAAGLEHVAASALTPLGHGEDGRYQQWDWAADRPGGWVTVPALRPGDLLIVEGCGALAVPVDTHIDVAIWCHAPATLRRARAMARDDGGWAEQWAAWALQEDLLVLRREPDLCWDTT